MAIYKDICGEFSEVTSFLIDKGFSIIGDKIIWSQADQDSQCYLKIVSDNGHDQIFFIRTDTQNAFPYPLIDFYDGATRPHAGIIFMNLAEGGYALYLGMVESTVTITDLFFCCSNDDDVLNNGLIVCSPPEEDGYWYYGWNDVTDIPEGATGTFQWALDNGHNNYEYGQFVSQIPQKKVIQSPGSITLVRAYLNSDHWSKNFRVLVTGIGQTPCYVFQANGQRYIVFTNNIECRAPAYKLPADSVSQNLSTSTEEYSNMKKYALKDYCIYNGLLWKCKVEISTPEPFDDSHWQLTTVYDEFMDAANDIYDNLPQPNN
jgi:hypothetical protein